VEASTEEEVTDEKEKITDENDARTTIMPIEGG
jgi:hypothetical protein